MIVWNYDDASYNRTDVDDDMKFTTTIKSLIMNLNFMLKKKILDLSDHNLLIEIHL